jgi:Zn-finger nucleic acid-binding protein
MTCPRCGAPVGSAGHRCQFCSAELLVRACPRCFARIFHGHSHCPHCGVGVEAPAQANPDGSPRVRACPRCAGGTQLVARLIAGVLLDECPACCGVWLDAGAVDRVVRERREQSLSTLRQVLGPSQGLVGDPAGAPAQPARMYIRCPDCDQIMNRVNFARRSGILLDVCRAHGTWFDAAELPRVVEFVLKGGVEDSQRREIQELREQARRAAADAEAARSRAAWAGDPAHDLQVDLFGSALGLIGRLLT